MFHMIENDNTKYSSENGKMGHQWELCMQVRDPILKIAVRAERVWNKHKVSMGLVGSESHGTLTLQRCGRMWMSACKCRMRKGRNGKQELKVGEG